MYLTVDSLTDINITNDSNNIAVRKLMLNHI